MFVGGDSAGGNLTLSLIAWTRDTGLRAPDAAVALSPLADATLASPSIRANMHNDAMLGPLFGKLARVPRWLTLWLGWLQTWNHMVHVWQIFNPELSEARDALAEIERFLSAIAPPPIMTARVSAAAVGRSQAL